jgi:uncharacterized protein (TIGR03086 family)
LSTSIRERSFASTRSVLVNVTPANFGLPTPCASWDVRALLNHMVGGTRYFADCVSTGTHPERAPVDFTTGDIVASYDEGVALAIDAFAAPGAQERMVTLPFGTLPVSVFIGIASTDAFSHGWDLARAAGQSTDLDSELAAELLERARASLPETFRGPDGRAPFGPIVDAPASATAADQLAAFLGRTV